MRDDAADANPWIAREKAELVGLMCLPGMTPRRLRDMLVLFGSPAGAWESVLRGAADGYGEAASSLSRLAAGVDLRQRLSLLEMAGISVAVRGERIYPAMLAQIHDPPVALFIRGEEPEAVERVAIVGSRKATPYGLEVARYLAEGLAAAGVCVVSGAARGIDAAAHAGAIAAGGRTLAVLGCGVDVVYPPANARLYEKIREQGALMSEYCPGTGPRPYQFPERNRIIAGLSRAVIVAEASEKSGALITADFALAEGRDVMAVPGQVFSPNSAGTHGLLRSGAMLITGPDDVLGELGLSRPSKQAGDTPADETRLSADERGLLEVLQGGPVEVEAIVLATGLQAGKGLAVLGSLEVRGLISRAPGGRYQRCRPRG